MTDRITSEDFVRHVKGRTRVDHETPIHLDCLAWLHAQFPDALIHHSANESGLRGGASSSVARAQGRAKDMGMMPGFPDLLVIWRGHVWGIEIKAPKGRVQASLEKVGLLMENNGARWAVVRSRTELEEVVAAWLRVPTASHIETRGQIT